MTGKVVVFKKNFNFLSSKGVIMQSTAMNALNQRSFPEMNHISVSSQSTSTQESYCEVSRTPETLAGTNQSLTHFGRLLTP